jgi:uncharacterized OsmC-like protein
MRQVTVRSLPGHTYTVEAENGKHAFLSDEEESSGGEDLGPTPHELLAASLGSCVAITLRMYANHKQWPVGDIAVQLTVEHVEPSEPEFTPEEIAAVEPGTRLPLIRSHVIVTGDLDEAQRNRLQEVASRCPVHRTLRARPAIVTTLQHVA